MESSLWVQAASLVVAMALTPLRPRRGREEQLDGDGRAAAGVSRSSGLDHEGGTLKIEAATRSGWSTCT
jgi:hypothetical protein